jgi:uncharacterized protein (DUF885 family)
VSGGGATGAGGGASGSAGGASESAGAALAALSEDFFTVLHSVDPLGATQLGVSGFDGALPDPSRAGAQSHVRALSAIEDRLAAIDCGRLDTGQATNASVLGALAGATRADLEHGLWAANASAQGYANPQAMAFQAIPTALLEDRDAVDTYLGRVSGLGSFFAAIGERYREASAEGRTSPAVGVRQAIDQLEGHLASDPAHHRLQPPTLPGDVDHAAVRAAIAATITEVVRPAMARLRDVLRDELLPGARGDDAVGISTIPGGAEGYAAAVARHTTTTLTPEQIHAIGLESLEALRDEWAQVGARALPESDPDGILARLRDDPALRFNSTQAIVATVTDALARAEAARDEWFPHFTIPECVIEEIDPLEAGNSTLAYYRPPAAGGRRPGAHCVLTAHPEERFIYEYEALAFHESTPGHHLQVAYNQTLTALPAFRRYLDAEVCAYVEGWGLYSERLADEMGLYSSDVFRLGMLSFDALRACRLVVDTGMHHLGWSRERAIDFMWSHTATTRANVTNEIDRYIGWPGQALAYMIGRREIQALRGRAQAALGARFDVRRFHGAVLGEGAVPLGVLGEIIDRWVTFERAAGASTERGSQRCA